MTDAIAHRGASQATPENTAAAFRSAVAMGAQRVELDARRTADGVVVVDHDAVLPDGRAVVGTRWGVGAAERSVLGAERLDIETVRAQKPV